MIDKELIKSKNGINLYFSGFEFKDFQQDQLEEWFDKNSKKIAECELIRRMENELHQFDKAKLKEYAEQKLKNGVKRQLIKLLKAEHNRELERIQEHEKRIQSIKEIHAHTNIPSCDETNDFFNGLLDNLSTRYANERYKRIREYELRHEREKREKIELEANQWLKRELRNINKNDKELMLWLKREFLELLEEELKSFTGFELKMWVEKKRYLKDWIERELLGLSNSEKATRQTTANFIKW